VSTLLGASKCKIFLFGFNLPNFVDGLNKNENLFLPVSNENLAFHRRKCTIVPSTKMRMTLCRCIFTEWQKRWRSATVKIVWVPSAYEPCMGITHITLTSVERAKPKLFNAKGCCKCR